MSRRWLGRGALTLIAATGFVTFWSAERGSVERANRLFRQGDVEQAARLYEERTRAAPADARLRYNLGTTLAVLDSPDAELELSRASPSGPLEIQALAEYNRGLLNLKAAIEVGDADSIRARAAAAVTANRRSIRIRPDNDDAKWNLALALRLLDSIDTARRRSGREQTDGAVETDAVTRSTNVPDVTEDEPAADDPPAEGERETVVALGDEAPLTPEEAAELLGESHLDPTAILEKLLALEGRGRWGGRTGRPARRW